ncbi:MAG: ribose 5-phosphate isomerase B [Coriobacteriales bacterium]|nr:ribose 5-phosphate isomerase B [Coriobacteriales bacterium]
MKIVIASDHGGFEQKEQLKEWLDSQDLDVVDSGCYSNESVDYPDFAKHACERVVNGQCDFGILVCGTGIGMAIAANKVDGIRAANCVRADFAQLSREHNNANVLTLSGRFVDLETNKEIADAFLNTDFAGDRHERRVNKIMALEEDD